MAAGGPRWFSANPSKAWGEKFFLAYLPFFVALNAAKQAFGWLDAGNLWHVGQNVLLLAPLYAVPALVRDERPLGRPWYRTYWFKFNLWIYVFAFAGTYFFTEYFFDVLGMVYHFPRVSWSFDAALVGSGRQRVPLGMYFNGAAFFVVYHTLAVIVLRRVRSASRPGWWWGQALAVAGCACLFAWAETRLIAREANSANFFYRDLDFMLRRGTFFYACYFLVSFPMVYRLDEERTECWTVRRTVIDSLAASMLVFYLLDFATHVLGARWAAALC